MDKVVTDFERLNFQMEPFARNSVFFRIIFALTLTARNICLTHITPSILISANALGYTLSIKVEFGMQNMMSICLFCCILKGGGLKSTTSRKVKKTNETFKVTLF